MTFRVLAAVNADAFGLDRRVGSIDDAIAVLGVVKLRCLADLLVSSTDVFDDTHAAAHLELGVARADMAAALLNGTADRSRGVTTALLSVADRLYGTALSVLLDELPVDNLTADAILHGHGRIGEVLDITRACERGDRGRLEVLAPGRGDELLTIHEGAARRASAILNVENPTVR